MNDIEKANEILMDIQSESEDGEEYEAFNTALKALEKQLPKTPLFDDNGGYPEYLEHWLACPICDEAIPEYTAKNNTWCYCLGCGQRIDWLEVENE